MYLCSACSDFHFPSQTLLLCLIHCLSFSVSVKVQTVVKLLIQSSFVLTHSWLIDSFQGRVACRPASAECHMASSKRVCFLSTSPSHLLSLLAHPADPSICPFSHPLFHPYCQFSVSFLVSSCLSLREFPLIHDCVIPFIPTIPEGDEGDRLSGNK